MLHDVLILPYCFTGTCLLVRAAISKRHPTNCGLVINKERWQIVSLVMMKYSTCFELGTNKKYESPTGNELFTSQTPGGRRLLNMPYDDDLVLMLILV